MNDKLVVCSPELGIAPESNSGGEVYDRETVLALCQKGLKVVVLLPLNKKYLPHKNLKVYRLPIPFVWPPYLFNLLIVPYLFYIYQKEKFNILRVHSPYFVGLGALFFKIFHRDIPLVVTYHHLEDKNILFDLINKLFIKKWNTILADSQFTKKEIIKNYSVDSQKVVIVYAGVAKNFKPEQKNQNLVNRYYLNNRKVLLFLGELKPRKNIDFLLSVIAKIESNFKLIIAGSGQLDNSLKEKVKQLKLENRVVFTGFVSEQDKVSFYSVADIFLFPSLKEGFGMPVIEAGACGIPSIVSNVSSLKELIINGQTGYLVQLNNINEWKEKIEDLLQNDKKRKTMGRMAEKFSRNFSWQKAAQEQVDIYKKLLK